MSKNNNTFIMLAFGLAYIFFGLGLLMPDLPFIIRIITSIGALFIGMIFIVLSAYNLPKKPKK